MLLFGSIIVLKFVFLGPVEATKAESYSNNRLWKQVQLYSCTILHNFFYLVDMSVFHARYGFSVPCIRADPSSFY